MRTRYRLCAIWIMICMILSGTGIPCAAAESASDYYVTAHSSLYQDAFPVHLYEKGDGQLYIDAVTLAGISGYTQTGDNKFTLGSRKISAPRTSKINGVTCFPLEKTLDYFNVRVWEKDGELYFLAGQEALSPIFEAIEGFRRFSVPVDPDDFINTLGVALNEVKNLLLTWNIKPLLDRYREAVYKVVREDMNETLPSALRKKWEDKIKPVASAYDFLGGFKTKEEIMEICSGSDLQDLAEYLDAKKMGEKALGMKLSDYLRRLEELTLFFDTNCLAMKAMQYVAESEPEDAMERDIVRTAKEILDAVTVSPEEWNKRLLKEMGEEQLVGILTSTTGSKIKELLYGKKNPVIVLTKLVTDNLPVFKSMSKVEEAYTFAEIQEYFCTLMITAEVDHDWIMCKYMAFIYDRCYYDACEVLKDAVPDWNNMLKPQQEECLDQMAQLAAIPDSALAPFMAKNDPVSPRSLQRCDGPEPDYGLLIPWASGNFIRWPDAVRQSAKRAWEDICAEYGEGTLAEYGIDEGDGAVLPVLSIADGSYFLTVLVQQDDILCQVILRMDESGTFRLVLVDRTLILGDRASLFLYSNSGNALISEACLEVDVAAFAAAGPDSAEKRVFPGDPYAGSMADMGFPALEAFEAAYGNPEWTVRVDANGGLFQVTVREPESVETLLDVVNR